MTMTVVDRAPVSGDAGRVTGEQRDRLDPEVPERARRRTFTAQYKLDILAAYDAAGPGEKGALCAGRACIPVTSWTGGGPGMPERWPDRDGPWAPGGRSTGCADRPVAEREGPAGAGAG